MHMFCKKTKYMNTSSKKLVGHSVQKIEVIYICSLSKEKSTNIDSNIKIANTSCKSNYI